MDTFAAIEEGLRQELGRDKRLWALVERLTEDEALELGREAGRAVLGPILLRDLLGDDRFDTAAAARLLQVTRHALHKGARAGRLLGVPGRGTTWYPAWQFDVAIRAGGIGSVGRDPGIRTQSRDYLGVGKLASARAIGPDSGRVDPKRRRTAAFGGVGQ